VNLRLAKRVDQEPAPLAPLAPPAPPRAPVPDPELVSERDRLVERMAIMQSELGGLFYEMAIRDHVRMDVLIAKAAELQGVDTELSELEGRLRDQRVDATAPTSSPTAGHCPACAAPYLPGAAYCSQCAHAL
jgi:hypothetical protein